MALKVRLLGEEHEIRQVLRALRDAPGVRLVDTSGARPARRDGGVRVYALVEVRPPLRAEDATSATAEAAAAIEAAPAPETPDA